MLALALATQLSLAAGPTQLTLDIQPPGVEVKVDGKKIGTSGDKPLVVKVKPGNRVVRLVYKGDAHEEEVSVKAGEKKIYAWKFEGSGGPKPAVAEPGEEASP
jgi:hypothetical protein